MKKGEFFTEENMRSIRPAYGLHPRHFKAIIGKKSTQEIKRGTPLSWSMVDIRE